MQTIRDVTGISTSAVSQQKRNGPTLIPLEQQVWILQRTSQFRQPAHQFPVYLWPTGSYRIHPWFEFTFLPIPTAAISQVSPRMLPSTTSIPSGPHHVGWQSTNQDITSILNGTVPQQPIISSMPAGRNKPLQTNSNTNESQSKKQGGNKRLVVRKRN